MQDETQVESVFGSIKDQWGKLDILIHCLAFANRDDLSGDFSNTSREGFQMALDVSAYSLITLARGAKPLMTDGGSIVTLTYLGGVRVVPNYNVMGIAKSALEMNVRYLASEMGGKQHSRQRHFRWPHPHPGFLGGGRHSGYDSPCGESCAPEAHRHPN